MLEVIHDRSEDVLDRVGRFFLGYGWRRLRANAKLAAVNISEENAKGQCDRLGNVKRVLILCSDDRVIIIKWYQIDCQPVSLLVHCYCRAGIARRQWYMNCMTHNFDAVR